jgi:hypothetical protein
MYILILNFFIGILCLIIWIWKKPFQFENVYFNSENYYFNSLKN